LQYFGACAVAKLDGKQEVVWQFIDRKSWNAEYELFFLCVAGKL